MATASLTNTNINDTYVGVLHAKGAPIPASGMESVYDGFGNKSALKIGREGVGLAVCGALSANNVDDDFIALLADRLYPVGSVFLSVDNTNPQDRFGGTWTQVSQGRFVAGVGQGTDSLNQTQSFAAENGTSGTYYHTLTIPQLPSHRHDLQHPDTGEQFYAYTDEHNYPVQGVDTFTAEGGEEDNDGRYYPYTNYTGGGASHNNMPPEFGVYVWKRTA